MSSSNDLSATHLSFGMASSQTPISVNTFSPPSSNAFTVEIRRDDQSFVDRVPASKGISLEPGLYFATARLPSGVAATRSVQVGPSASHSWTGPIDNDVPLGKSSTVLFQDPSQMTVTLKPSSGREDLLSLRNLSKNMLSDCISDLPKPKIQLEMMGAQPGENQFRLPSPDIDREFGSVPSRAVWHKGNPLSSAPLVPVTDLPDQLLFEKPLRIEPPQDGLLTVQWQRPRQLALNMVLPVCSPVGCSLVAHYIDGEQPRLDVILDNSDADLLVRYLQAGYSADAMSYFNEHAAQQLLEEKMDDPIGALIGAYALLQFANRVGVKPADDDLRQSWTENLQNKFPTIPDSLVIRAEQLARNGEHREALNRLLRLPERGLPIFSVGLSLAIDRLGMYYDFGQSENQLEPSTFDKASLDQAKKLLDRLRRFGAFAVYSLPYLTYSGIDPSKPSTDVLSDSL